MRELFDAVKIERSERWHTFDILRHLLDSVDIDQLDDLHSATRQLPVDPEQDISNELSWEEGRLRWIGAWNFLRDENYIITGIDPVSPRRFTLSDDGRALLEELSECRTDRDSPLYIVEDTSDKSVNSYAHYATNHFEFQMRLYRTIGVTPAGTGKSRRSVDPIRDSNVPDGGHSTADPS